MDYLAHHGIPHQKWGVRRFQNPDGSLTPEGILRYTGKHESAARKLSKYSYKVGGNNTSIGRMLKKKSDNHYAKARVVWDEYSKKMSKKAHDPKVIEEATASFAKRHGVSKAEAKKHAESAMNNYKNAEKSDVIKKYPHDFGEFGHPIDAGGYANQKLVNDIEAKSGSWYFGEAVSPGFKKALSQYYESGRKDKVSILNTVLDDLGFEKTQANRDAIESSVFWD